jgi:hypothetical protein
MEKNNLQKTIDQIGKDAVSKSLSHAGISIGFCDVHGHYNFTSNNICPLCPKANGDTATEVEHYINVREAVGMDGTNPQQKGYGV